MSPPSRSRELHYIPGQKGLPVVGTSPWFFLNPRRMARQFHQRYGPCYRSDFMGTAIISLVGPDAIDMVLRDRSKAFSSRLGWGLNLERLFPRGLMLRDFEDHRTHRRIMQSAFRHQVLEGYLEGLNRRIAERIPRWIELGDLRIYPQIKQLALDNAAEVFLGIELGKQADRVNQAFIDTVAASITMFPWAIPGSAFHRGLRGRRILVDFLRPLIASRRIGTEPDMLSRLCRAHDDEGRQFDDDEVIDHMVFLLMAAHDTVTSVLTTTIYYLAAYPQWQQRLRDEGETTIGHRDPSLAELETLDTHERVIKEAMRLWTPAPYIARRTVQDVEFAGYRIPANTQISVSPDFVHRDPRIWTDPGCFDPDRFGPGRAEHQRHRSAFVPFGAGAHTCIGLKFAMMKAKALLHHLTMRSEWSLRSGYQPKYQQIPIPKPRDGLPLQLRSR